jgi:DICT domain-containing protein
VAVTLDEVEQRLAALILQDFAHELAERVHVVAQRRVLEREENAFAGHGRESRTVSLVWFEPRRAA